MWYSQRNKDLVNIQVGEVKQIIIKNRTYYFYNDQINLKDFDASLLKVDRKYHKDIDTYYVGYVTVIIVTMLTV